MIPYLKTVFSVSNPTEQPVIPAKATTQLLSSIHFQGIFFGSDVAGRAISVRG